jgi:hypothetical protein
MKREVVRDAFGACVVLPVAALLQCLVTALVLALYALKWVGADVPELEDRP